MAFESYFQFAAPENQIVAGNVNVKPDTDFIKTGQFDGVSEGNQPEKYKAKAGWMRAILWNYQAQANFNAAAGSSTGNITDTFCTILKFHGENSAFAYRAMFTRAMFNVTLEATERLGNDQNTMNTRLVFTNCTFIKIASATGNPLNVLASDHMGGSANTTNQYVGSDTKELDIYTFIYQAITLDTFKSKAKVSLQGKSGNA